MSGLNNLDLPFDEKKVIMDYLMTTGLSTTTGFAVFEKGVSLVVGSADGMAVKPDVVLAEEFGPFNSAPTKGTAVRADVLLPEEFSPLIIAGTNEMTIIPMSRRSKSPKPMMTTLRNDPKSTAGNIGNRHFFLPIPFTGRTGAFFRRGD